MLILYTLIGIVIYICFALIFAKLNFKKKFKKIYATCIISNI